MHISLSKVEVRIKKFLTLEELFLERISNRESTTRSIVLKGHKMMDRDYLCHTKRQSCKVDEPYVLEETGPLLNT